ncbi:MAG: hypothetical protein ACKVU4_13230 [Phycisphaerales bacterium]
MQRDSWVQTIAAGVLCLGLLGSAVVGMAVTASAGRNKLAYTERAEDSDPPQVSLGIAMGAFRGLFVNWLWMRANALKEAGRYHEAIDLASAITKLQPRFAHVWVFHAWNMAYNISVATNTPSERWQWVQAGIRLLRDEGIPANPDDLLLHRELAYIYIHKIQGWMDDANWYYKRKFAQEWTVILGEPPKADPLSRDRQKATDAYAVWFAPIVDAPDSPGEVVRRQPLAKVIVDRLRGIGGVGAGNVPATKWLEWHAVSAAILRSPQRPIIEASMAEVDREVLRLVEDPELAPGWDALLAFLRRRVLIDQYHMEPDRMLRCIRRFGPIDWRHPAAHALYWSIRGGERAVSRVGVENKKDYDFVNADRMAVHALQELWRSGEIYFDFLGSMLVPEPSVPFYTVLPNLYFTDSYGDTMKELRRRSSFDETKDAYSYYSEGYENFLVDATRFYYRRGQRDVAQQYYHTAATDPQFNLHTQDRAQRFSKPLDEFIFDETREEYTRPDIARLEVEGALQGAYIGGLLGGDGELFRAQFDFAKNVHRYFMAKQGRSSLMDKDMFRMELMPSDFRLLAADILVRLVTALDLDDAETLYNNAPEDLKRFAFDRITEVFGPVMADLQKRGGRTFAQVFIEPSGMDEHRAMMTQLLAAETARTLKLEQK